MIYKKFNNGITLIALIITIIILIILAGVTFALFINDSGILSKAQEARENYHIQKLKEEIEFGVVQIQIEQKEKGEDLDKTSTLKNGGFITSNGTDGRSSSSPGGASGGGSINKR